MVSVIEHVECKHVREGYLVMPWKMSTHSFQTYTSSQIVRAGLFLSLESICCLAPVRFSSCKFVLFPSHCFNDVSSLWVIETAVVLYVLCLKGNS